MPRQPSLSRTDGPKISDATVKRLSKYYRTLQNAIGQEKMTISSEEIARLNGLTAAQVRKDLSFFGAFGRRGLGYNVVDLHRNISQILGLHRTWNVCLVGAGNMGTALVHFKQFQDQGFLFKLVLDNDPHRIGTNIGDLVIEDFENCEELIKREKIRIAVVTVPGPAAQRAVDRLVAAGIKAILNFAPVTILVPPGVAVRNENMVIEIEALSYALTSKGHRGRAASATTDAS
ncbi:redox-sensing transcriptional repressor Rex [bacterium]|nr:redox-sensing transcriptional repressor Rex [bacterium]MBU1983470.1 redox-sensing transcriptional repressor Rex [bacterium]